MNALLLKLTNNARLSIGLKPLQLHVLLEQVAKNHAIMMAQHGYFDHVDHQGRAVGERLLQLGYNYRWAGENISAGKADAEAVFNWWMTSSAHRENILKPDYTVTGFGYCYIPEDRNAYFHYWVQVFASPL